MSEHEWIIGLVGFLIGVNAGVWPIVLAGKAPSGHYKRLRALNDERAELEQQINATLAELRALANAL